MPERLALPYPETVNLLPSHLASVMAVGATLARNTLRLLCEPYHTSSTTPMNLPSQPDSEGHDFTTMHTRRGRKNNEETAETGGTAQGPTRKTVLPKDPSGQPLTGSRIGDQVVRNRKIIRDTDPTSKYLDDPGVDRR